MIIWLHEIVNNEYLPNKVNAFDNVHIERILNFIVLTLPKLSFIALPTPMFALMFALAQANIILLTQLSGLTLNVCA